MSSHRYPSVVGLPMHVTFLLPGRFTRFTYHIGRHFLSLDRRGKPLHIGLT